MYHRVPKIYHVSDELDILRLPVVFLLEIFCGLAKIKLLIFILMVVDEYLLAIDIRRHDPLCMGLKIEFAFRLKNEIIMKRTLMFKCIPGNLTDDH